MSRVECNAELKFTVKLLELTEAEAEALDALVGYGVEPFLKVFYKEMGTAYLQPHEKGLRSLFAQINKQVHPALAHIKAVKREMLTKSRSR